jgi:hypothetical protein
MKINNLKFSNIRISPEKIRLILLFLFLVSLAIIEFTWGSIIYGLLIITFCLLSVFSHIKSPSLFFAIVLLISVVNLQNISDWVTIANSSIFNIHLDIQSVLTEISTPNSGEEIMPKKIQRMLSLLRTNDIAGYQLSEGIALDSTFIQRITESAWPIKNDDASPYYLCLIEEINTNPNCTVIDQRKDVALEYCP